MPVSRITIPFEDTRSFPRLYCDYINGDKKLDGFYSFYPDLSGYKEALEQISSRSFDRDLLVKVIRGQYASTAGCAVPERALALLAEKNTYTVCTGHQLCLFTGPLFFIYKIISAINIAEALKKEFPAYNFVPVYWMASEDHDAEEINHVHVFGRKLVWDTGQQGGAVGNFSTENIKSLIDEVKMMVAESPHTAPLIGMLEKAYLENKDLAHATRALVHALLGEYGLVVIDGNDKRLKSLFAPVMERDIFLQDNVKWVNASAEKLSAPGYEIQVHPREINVFYLGENSRTRIEKAEEKYRHELSRYPERFSPNVVLRPLYQQMILPNIACVGGPGELSYWLEYKSMFDHHDIFFPLLAPRNSALLLDDRAHELVKKAGIDYADIFLDTETLVTKVAEREAGEDISLAAEQEELKKIFERASQRAAEVDPTLKASTEAELHKALKGIQHLETKMLRSVKQKQEVSLNRLRKLKEKLFPGGKPQERYDNFIPYYIRHGEAFIAALKQQFDPLEMKFTILVEA